MNTPKPNHSPDSFHELATLLSTAYARLINDLATTLDLDTGAAQATHPATYSALTNDLAQQLDLNAGLAAIVTGGSLPPPNDTQQDQPVDQAPDLDDPEACCPVAVEHLRSLDAPTRLALRAAPAFRSLRGTLELGEFVARALALESASDLAHAHALVSVLARDHALDRDLDLARGHAFDLASNLESALNLASNFESALNLASNLESLDARDLARDLTSVITLMRDLTSDDPDRDLTSALDRALAHVLASARGRVLVLESASDLARTLASDRDLARDLTSDRDQTNALASALTRALDLARDHALDRARDLARDLNHTLASDLARTLAITLMRDLTSIGALVPVIVLVLTLASDLDRVLDRASALEGASDLDRVLVDLIGDAFESALTIALGLIRHVISGYGQILGLRLNLGQEDHPDRSALTQARIALAEVGDDFVGADLRTAETPPDSVWLEGVRWSNETQWPPEWVDYVRAASDEIGHGLFQITRTDGRRSPTYAPM